VESFPGFWIIAPQPRKKPTSFVETFFELVRLCGDEKQIVAFAGD
jgi:hypothetical protein